MLSQRRACLVVGIHRSVARHQSQRGDDSELRERLKELATEYPRYGYELLHGMLKAEGLVVNENKTYRIYREEKLQVRRKRRKRLLAVDRVQMPIPERPNQRWFYSTSNRTLVIFILSALYGHRGVSPPSHRTPTYNIGEIFA